MSEYRSQITFKPFNHNIPSLNKLDRFEKFKASILLLKLTGLDLHCIYLKKLQESFLQKASKIHHYQIISKNEPDVSS